MLNNTDMHGDRDEARDREIRQPDRAAAPAFDRPITDREVPLGAHAGADASTTINQWLDGELPESAARSADAQQVAFWNSVNTQADQRRRMTTPAHVADAIMAALPEKYADKASLSAHGLVSQENARLSLTPISAAAAAAGFTALGVLIGRVMGR